MKHTFPCVESMRRVNLSNGRVVRVWRDRTKENLSASYDDADIVSTCIANATNDTQLLCEDLLGNATRVLHDCSSYDTLYTAILTLITPVLKWALVFLGVVGFLNLLAFACSCCLICAKSRNRAFYKPAATYANGV